MSRAVPRSPRLRGKAGKFQKGITPSGLLATLDYLGLSDEKKRELLKKMQSPQTKGEQG